MIHASPLPDVEIPDELLVDFVLARADELGDKPALVDGPSGRTLTYGALLAAVRSLAGGLVARGFEPGQTLAVLAPNLPEYAVVFHGVAYAGGVVTTINPTYTAHEIHHQLVDADARLLVTVAPFLEAARTAAEGTSVEEIFVIGEADGATPLTALMGEPLADQVPRDVHATVALPYSSGTTGVWKGVMLSHRNLVANVAQVLGPADLREGETLIAVLPFFHIYGMQVLMNCGLRTGATIVTMPRFDLEQFLSIHQEYGVTRSFVAPPIVVAMAKHPLVDSYDLSKLEQVFSGAAPLSAELALEAGKRLGCEVVQGYGMTEMSPVSHLTPVGQFKPGSVGGVVTPPGPGVGWPTGVRCETGDISVMP
jgi:4-coumarate--CoA ligase